MNVMASEIISILKYIIDGTEMSYTSFVFFGCLAAFLVIFFLLRRQTLKRILILAANLIFYVWAGNRGALFIVCMTALIVYLAARRMETIYSGYEEETKGQKPKERMRILSAYKKKTKRYLVLALILILAIWIYVKVGKYLDYTTVGLLRSVTPFKSVIVPLGISYYSLSAIGYLLDVYWRKVKPEHNFLTLFTAMTYFPHIVQGPISKYQKLIKQMNAIPKPDYQRVCFGLQRMLWGCIQKMVVADRLAIYTDAVFAEPVKFAGIEILLAIVLCVFQLYADFAGCMNIVLGISQVMGIELDENFRQPFFSRNAAEFWRRWHITLGAWMREYIYLPISTSPGFIKRIGTMKKNGKVHAASFLRVLLPSVVVWLLTGLWHGTGIDYVVWGLYWCALIVLSSELKPLMDKVNNRMHINTDGRGFQTWQRLRTFIEFGIGRMFTVAGGLAGFGILWKQLFFKARLWTLFDGSLYNYGLERKDFYVALLGIAIIILVDCLHEKGIKIREKIASFPLPLRWIIYLAAIFSILILGMYGSDYDASSFIYGAF